MTHLAGRLVLTLWWGLFCSSLLAACRGEAVVTRRQVLESLVDRVTAPGVRELDAAQAALAEQLAQLERAPSPAQLSAAQTSWQRAMQAWERVSLYRLGPVIDARLLLRTTYWPVRVAALDALLREEVRPKTVDALGVDVRGMFALEHLLFGAIATRVSSAAPSGGTERALAVALATHLAEQTRSCRERLGDASAWKAALVQDERQSVSRIVNILLDSIETLAEERIRALERSHRNPRELRGGPSGSTAALIQSQLTAAAQLYDGHGGTGLSHLVRNAAPDIDRHLQPLFAAALTTTQQLATAPFDPTSIQRARESLKQLEQALKAELPNALGVTLTFESGDGD
ncbi:MAG: imelysin family protein [Polyangiales bacterium]